MKATSAEECKTQGELAENRSGADEYDLLCIWLTLAELFKRLEALEAARDEKEEPGDE